MLQFKDWKDEVLFSIKAPSLIIVGDKDVVTPEHAIEMAHKIPNAELLVLPGTHGSYIGEAMTAERSSKIPALTLSVIQEFLEK